MLAFIIVAIEVLTCAAAFVCGMAYGIYRADSQDIEEIAALRRTIDDLEREKRAKRNELLQLAIGAKILADSFDKTLGEK